MRKLTVFNFLTLNGFYKGQYGDISWHRHGEEEAKFSEESLQSGNTLIFGRITYQMMASYWPTPEALRDNPLVAKGMNEVEKIVFSRTLENVEWNNTRLVRDNMIGEIKRMKQSEGRDMTILGSGNIITQLAEEGLIDGYQFMIDPVVIGAGTPIFHGITHKMDMELTETKTFKSGVVLLGYVPLRK